MAEGRRRYFAVADSIAGENWTNDELACMVRLMARMNGRWARDKLTPEEAAIIQLGPTEMMAISGKRRADIAAKSLRHLADIASMSMRYLGDVVEITWPKFPIFQNYASRARPQTGRSASASASSTASAEKNRRERAPSAPAAAPRRSQSGSAKIPRPDSFTGEARDRILRWAAEKGYDQKILRDGLERFREWKPLKAKTRDIDQWVSSFMRVVREGVEKGQLVPASKATGGTRYRDADQVIAEARKKQAEDDARQREIESPEEIGNLIDLALHREVAS